MGNAKDGVRRRRLDYKLARKIFNIAFKRTTSMVNLRDYMTAHFKDIVPGDKMTKTWRKKVIGGGKAMGGAVSSLAEKWQRMCLEKITSTPCAKTNLRLNLATSELKIVTRPSNEPDEFEWTEDFDGEFHVGKTRYLVNFKMIVGTGGAQTRSMREVYHFIKCQEAYLKSSGDKHTKFLNILDGDSVGAKMDVMRKACSKKRAVNIFVGDTHEIKKAWKF
jgi:hypothetical protein